MASNSLGDIFRITTYGESHGDAIGVIIDGCPSGIPITVEEVHQELLRRSPGQSHIVTQRKEKDYPVFLSGVFDNMTTGMPVHIQIKNEDKRSKDYEHIKDSFRPSHADFTYNEKYRHRDYRGGGRSSARETANWVAASVIAQKILDKSGIEIKAWVSQVGDIVLNNDISTLDLNKIDDNIVRCPDQDVADLMINLIEEIRKEGDTIGGVITCKISHCPIGIGEPIFKKLHAQLAHAVMSINACKGFEIGGGFDAARMRGSQHNDLFHITNDKIKTVTNFSGGVQGGISNGMPIVFKAAFKPVATVMYEQKTVDKFNQETSIKGKGRHDPCVVPRAVPIVEAVSRLVLADLILLNRIYNIDE